MVCQCVWVSVGVHIFIFLLARRWVLERLELSSRSLQTTKSTIYRLRFKQVLAVATATVGVTVFVMNRIYVLVRRWSDGNPMNIDERMLSSHAASGVRQTKLTMTDWWLLRVIQNDFCTRISASCQLFPKHSSQSSSLYSSAHTTGTHLHKLFSNFHSE